MAEFNKDDYLNDLPDADDLNKDQAAGAGAAGTSSGHPDGADAPSSCHPERSGAESKDLGGDAAGDASATASASAQHDNEEADASAPVNGTGASASANGADASSCHPERSEAESKDPSGEDTLTPLGKAKQEAAEYLEALQRERAEFINYRNRAQKEQERFRQHGIIDVLTALLPALDDIDRIRQNSEMDDSFKAVAAKIDKAFEKFGVEKFGEAGEDFDPTRHDAILHKPDASDEKETVDTVVEAGYRIGERVIRAARVVVASPQA